jgi:hypothetical protein
MEDLIILFMLMPVLIWFGIAANVMILGSLPKAVNWRFIPVKRSAVKWF